MLPELAFSTRIADLMPRNLVTFRGIEQDQGSWQWCIDFNRRQMPTLKPIAPESLQNVTYTDRFKFIPSWKAFRNIQQYTDGEAFFLCYPAAFLFGIYGKSGKYQNQLLPSWRKAYAHDQTVTASGGENESLFYSSSIFDRKFRDKFQVRDSVVTNWQELQSVVDSDLNNKIHVVQVSCNYPMFGNKRFGHYISIVDSNRDTGKSVIAGSLAPFGIYESPFAAVNSDQLGQYIETSNQLMSGTKRNLSIDLKDQSTSPGINIVTVEVP